MGMTLAEKILADHCGKQEVHPGQFINARVDIVMASELSGVVAIEEFEKIKGARFALLSSIDIFSVWVIVLLVMGFGIVSKLPRAQSIGIVVVFWLIYVIGKTGLVAVGQMMQSAGAGGGA